MQSLRSRNYVHPPTSVLALAKLAGMSGRVSLRELMRLLGPAKFGPRPFYVIGHNTNTPEEVFNALAVGANALEIDVSAYEDRPTVLCVSHEGITGDDPGEPTRPSLVDFLKFLRQRADELPTQLALVIFDTKSPAAKPSLGKVMLEAIHAHLIDPDNPLNIIISTATLGNHSLFDEIAPMLGPREALMIDQEGSPISVEALFKETLGLRPQCYGYGNSFWDTSANTYRGPLEHACWMRAQRDAFHFVYAWTVNTISHQAEFMRIGVDGMITDTEYIGGLVDLVTRTFASSTRLAERADNPFMPPNAAYALTVTTGSDGTDADITFRLRGGQGVAAKTVDTEWTGRMESGDLNYVVVPSPDLGELASVSVQSDRSGNGPDWFLNTIVVESVRYHAGKVATFNRSIDGTGEVSSPLE